MTQEFAPIQGVRAKTDPVQRRRWLDIFGAPAARAHGQAPDNATLNAQVWISATPWRITAGWAALAGLLAAGVMWEWQEVSLQRVVLLWLLVDPLWGALWRLASGRDVLLALPTGGGMGRLRLPYLQPASPAAQLLALDESNALPYLFRIGLPTLALACVAALTLSNIALLLTLGVAVLTAIGWGWRRTWQRPPLMLQALVGVGLPWLLALWEGSQAIGGHQGNGAIALAILWTIHHWGELRGVYFENDRLAWVLLAVAEVGIGVLLIVLQAPFWLPVLAILALPTWLAVLRRRPLEGLSLWWLAALILCALAVGQSVQ